jgi:hypothetical protein
MDKSLSLRHPNKYLLTTSKFIFIVLYLLLDENIRLVHFLKIN